MKPTEENTSFPHLEQIEALAREIQKGKEISDIAHEMPFDGVDTRKEVLVSILQLAMDYADFLSVMTGQQEYDDCKSQQMAAAVASAYETVSYSNNSMRINEVIQSINRDQGYQEHYFFDRYQELDEEDESSETA